MLRPSFRRSTALIALTASIALRHGDASADGWALDRYDPAPAGDTFFAAEFPWYNRSRPFALALVADYAREPLVLRRDGQATRALIENMAVAHLQGGVAFADRVGLHVSVPIALVQSGADRDPALPGIGAFGSPAVGDVRVGARVRLWNDAERDAVSLHIGAQGYLGFLGYADRDWNVTDEAFRFRGYVTVAGHPGPIRYSFSGGYHARPRTEIADVAIDDDIHVSGAIGYVTAQNRLTVGPEAWASIVYDGPTGRSFSSRQITGEAIVAANYHIADQVLVGIGAGAGLSQAVGTPQFRALLRVAYVPTFRETPRPVPGDRDRDGVIDIDDECVSEPQGEFPDPHRPGCPLRDADNDRVFDGDDRCVQEPAGDHPDPQHPGCPVRDVDSDEVIDSEDRCPTTARGAHPDPERPGCPDGDADTDGVLDHDDACRAQHQGVHPDPSRAGCPLPDRDNDSVPDPSDHCPEEPGAPHPNPERNGCPGLVRVEGGRIRILRPVFFASNRDRILPQSFPVLQSVADALSASPDIRKLSIDGHTDDAGDDARNMDLSQRRAASVMTWLLAHGVDASRLEAHGYGESRPMVPMEATMRRPARDAARAQNRRVEFRIVDPAAPTAPDGAPDTAR